MFSNSIAGCGFGIPCKYICAQETIAITHVMSKISFRSTLYHHSDSISRAYVTLKNPDRKHMLVRIRGRFIWAEGDCTPLTDGRRMHAL